MSGLSGNVSIPLAEWMEHVRSRDALEVKVGLLEQEVRRARAADPSGQVQALLAGLRAARWPICLAMQYPGKRWPIAELRAFAEAFQAMPDATIDELAVAIDMLAFCKEIDLKGALQEAAPMAGHDLDRNVDHGRRPDAPAIPAQP